MNGQQLTNSSNSANGTPSSSYPASLSSQSSRDPSPATRPGVPHKPFTESYNHVISSQPNHWPKDKGNALLSGLMDPLQPRLSTPQSTPTPTPPVTSSLQQSTPGSQGLQTSITQPTCAPSKQTTLLNTSLVNQQPTPVVPTSQPMYRFPPPTSLSQTPTTSTAQSILPSTSQPNHIPPPSLANQYPAPDRPTVHPTYQHPQTNQQLELSRSSKSPQQPLSQYQSQPAFHPPSSSQFSQHSSQFQKPVTAPFQQQQSQFQKLSAGHAPQPPYQFSQPSDHLSKSTGQLIQSQSKFPQTPNKSPQPPIQTAQSQPSNQISQPPTQVQNKFSQHPNQITQPPGQTTQSQNQFAQPTNQFHKASNQMAQPTNQFSQPPNQFSQPPNQFSQPPNQFSLPPNQVSQPANQFSQPPNQFSQPPNQFSQPPNHFSQPPSHLAQQVPGQPPLLQGQSPLSQGQFPGSFPQQQYPGSGVSQSFQQQVPNQFNKRYPQMPQQPGAVDGLANQVSGMSVQQGFNKLWGMDTVDLLKSRDLLPKAKLQPPPVRLIHELYEAANCSPEIFRCTLTKIPETKSLLEKSRLPLGVLIHPFKDLNDGTEDPTGTANIGQWQHKKNTKQLSVIQCTVIVRCRMCRTYINPFVYFVDNKRWKCNLCFRVNELPDEFQFDPMTKTYGDPSRRPEIKSATIEFIAPSEYMVRPPQPAIYVFVMDVSRLACECGYLDAVCRTLLAELENLPGDARTSVAFITFDSAVHFYSLTEGQAQPHQMIVVDIDDMFLPTPDNLLVSLNECRDLIRDLLQELPNKYRESYDTHSALGAALQAAYKLLAPTGGRVTVFQACLPNAGPGALTAREDPAQRAGDNPPHLNPSTDFYKKLALDCSGQQIAVDLFLVNSQYVDLATLSGVSRFSGGCMHHIPLYRSDKPLLVETLERLFQRYLTRKIGFESVMRLRCTRGMSIHTFHGNFFVRSTDLLSLPNANPDAGFGMQVTIDENLTEIQNVCFQAALLYTSSKGERRIRVHTLCLPVASNLADILHGADQQCIAGLLAKMAVDRAIQSSLSDAREAFVNVVSDILSAYKLTQTGNTAGCMLAPFSLRLLPLYILALLKHMAFRVGQSTRLDDRVFAMCQMKSLPLTFLMQSVYPDLYCLLNIEQQPEIEVGDHSVPQPPRLQLSAERIDSHGFYLLDDGTMLLVYVGHNIDSTVCQAIFDVPHFSAIPQEMYSLPELDNPTSKALRDFINYLQNEKPYPTPLQVVRDDSHHRLRFLERLIEDKNESGTSYYEFLQRVKSLTK